MRNTLILLILFLALGGGTYWYLNQQPVDSSIARWDTNFAVENINDIHKVFMANRKGETITLERNGDHWIYNKEYRVRPGKIKNLLESINRQRVKYIPPQAAIKTAIEGLSTKGIKVEIYGKDNEKIKAFYVGDVTSNGTGTYMIMEDSEEPIVMHIPFWEGSLRGRYWEPAEAWKDRSLFRHQIDEIQSVAVEYPRQKNKSFVLNKKGNDYEVRPFYEITPQITKKIGPGNVERYLSGFKSLMAEGFRNESTKKDSIMEHIPFSTVSLVDTKGDSVVVNFFPQSVVKTDLIPKTTNLSPIEAVGRGIIERYWADSSDGNFYLVQNRVFGKIFWEYSAFYN